MTLVWLSAESPALPMRSMTFSRPFVTVPRATSESAVFVLNAKEHQPSTQSPRHVNAPPVNLSMLLETVLSDAESMKFSRMAPVAADLDSTQSKEFVGNVPGTRFMIKDLDFAESHVIIPESTISASNYVFVSLNCTRWLMEPVTNVLSIPPTMPSPRPVSVMQDSSKISAFAPLHAMPMNNLSTENVSAEMVTTSSVTAVDCALPLRFTTQPTESVILLVPRTKSGTPSSGPADVSQDSTSSTTSALNATPGLKFTATDLDAVIVFPDTGRAQVKDAMENALPSAHTTKIIS